MIGLTDAGVGLRGRGPVPRPVKVKVLAHVTVGAGGVMLAHAHRPAVVVAPTLGGVSVAFTPASDLQVGEGQGRLEGGAKGGRSGHLQSPGALLGDEVVPPFPKFSAPVVPPPPLHRPVTAAAGTRQPLITLLFPVAPSTFATFL